MKLNENYKHLIHILLLSLMISPNCMFYVSANIMSDQLTTIFRPETQQLAYSFISIPSIFSIISISMLIDAFSTVVIFPVLQLCCCVGTMLASISFSVRVEWLYLCGRLMYGVVGECTLTSQSKIISQLLPNELHATAFAAAFCGYMIGETMAAVVIPRVRKPQYAMLIVLSGQLASLAMSIYYSFLMKSKEVVNEQSDYKGDTISLVETATVLEPEQRPQQSSKSQIQQQIQILISSLKEILPSYYILLLARICYTASKIAYDSRSVVSLQFLLNITRPQAVNTVLIQSITSGIAFISFLYISYKWCYPQYYVFCGNALFLISIFIFLGAKHYATGIIISVLISCSFGSFACNVNALLVKMAGKNLGASALGLVFSLQYLMISGLLPLLDYLSGTYNQQAPGFVYMLLLMLAQGLLLFVIQKYIGWK